MAELLPCPFCGGKAVIEHNLSAVSVICERCSAMMGRTTMTDSFRRGKLSFDRVKEAIEAWNTRTPQKINHNSLCETDTYKVD